MLEVDSTQTREGRLSDTGKTSSIKKRVPVEGHSNFTLAVQGKTLADAYLHRVDLSPEHRAYLVKREGQYVEVNWSEIHLQILGIFSSYQKLGLNKGDRVCIASQSRPEWMIADIATFGSGLITVPIYQSSSVGDMIFILDNSEAKLVFAEDEVQCQKLVQAFSEIGRSLPVVIFNAPVPTIGNLSITSFQDFTKLEEKESVDKDFRAKAKAILPDDIASIVYTSGTTGVPKGAVLSHSNFTSSITSLASEIEMTSNDVTLTFLPFAHILGRVESMWPIFVGITLGFAENINSISQNIHEIRPTLLLAVPRIYEKIFAKIQAEVDSQPEFKKSLFRWAIGIGRQVARLRSEKQSVPLPLSLKSKIADQLVFTRIREKLGGRIHLTATGGAPLSRDICEFFHACGIRILEGYGLTETMGPITVNRPEDYRFGTVGLPLGELEIKIAEDGEILLRGPMIFREYFKNAEATKEAFTSDGWFCSGDIGEIDERGFLKITDRKKELIVTSGGKKVAPQKIENLLKSSRYLNQSMVYGDRQKYLTVLLTLNEEVVKNWAKDQSISWKTFEELTQHPRIAELIDEEIKAVNKQLASFESIKRFKILPHELTTESGELTPSLKIKRKVCAEKFKNFIQEMYA